MFDEHNDILNNIVSLELFKSVDRELYCKNKKIEYTISRDEAIVQAKNIVSTLYSTDDGKKYCNIFRKIHKQILLNLIGIMKINFSSKSGAQKKTEKYFEYINNILGRFIWTGKLLLHINISARIIMLIFSRE